MMSVVSGGIGISVVSMVGIAVVGISMAIAVTVVSKAMSVSIAVVGKAISIGTVVSIGISISSRGSLSISRPLAVVSMVTVGVGITSISMMAISVSMVGKAIAVAVVGKAIAVGAVVSIGVSLSGGGCSGSREQAEGSNGSGLHVYLFVCKLEEIARLPM